MPRRRRPGRPRRRIAWHDRGRRPRRRRRGRRSWCRRCRRRDEAAVGDAGGRQGRPSPEVGAAPRARSARIGGGGRGRSARHRWTVRPSSRVSSSAQAPRSDRSSPLPPSTMRVSRASGPRLRRVASSRIGVEPRLAEAVTGRGARCGGRRGRRSGRRWPSRAPGPRRDVTASAAGVAGPTPRRPARRASIVGARPAAVAAPQDRVAPGDRLEAAEPAAAALGAVGLDDDVADLAGAVAVALERARRRGPGRRRCRARP